MYTRNNLIAEAIAKECAQKLPTARSRFFYLCRKMSTSALQQASRFSRFTLQINI